MFGDLHSEHFQALKGDETKDEHLCFKISSLLIES